MPNSCNGNTSSIVHYPDVTPNLNSGKLPALGIIAGFVGNDGGNDGCNVVCGIPKVDDLYMLSKTARSASNLWLSST